MDLPIKMKATGDADPVTAVLALFVRKTAPCKGNLVDCEVAANMIFIDSLLEAETPNTFLKALPDEYLKIKMMDVSEFRNQDDTKNPLKRVPVRMPPRDLQVGDQCYIYNHSLYKTFRPIGSWYGEFAFVYSHGRSESSLAEGLCIRRARQERHALPVLQRLR